MALTERLALLVDANVDGAVRDIKTLAKESGRTDDQAKKLEARGKAIGTAWKIGAGVVATAALVKLGQLSKEAVQDASALGETVNKVGVVFEDEADKVLAFGETAAKSLGQSKNGALSAAAGFGLFFDAAGLASDAAADMSLELVGLASDMASFNDADPSEVIDNLRSGLSGESEPLRKFGVFLNEAAVAAKAAELGLQGVNGKLTDGEKIQARYAIILEQTTKQQGDFARTSDSLANKQRTQAALYEDASAALGEGLLPAQLAMTEAMVSAAPAVAAIAQGVGGLVKSFTDLPGPMQALIGATTILGGGYLLLAPRILETRLALKDLGTEAPRASRALSAVGKAAAAATVIIALDAALGALERTMKAAGPTTEELASALLDLAEGKAANLGADFDNLGKSVEILGDKTGGFLDGVEGGIPVLSKIDGIITGLIPGTNSAGEALDKASQKVAALDDAFSSLVSSGGADQAEVAFQQLAQSQGLSAEQTDKLLDQMPKYRDALASTANQTRILGGATNDLGAKTTGTLAPTDAMIERQEKLAEKLRKARDAARGTAREFVGLGDSLNDNEVGLNGWIREMEKAQDALENFRENAIKAARRGLRDGLIKELQAAGPEGAMRMRQLANATDAELARANKAWREQQAEMRRWVAFKVPPKKVEVDTSGARAELEGFIRDMNGRTISLNSTVATHKNARALGGPVTGGEMYLVGERGPEMFVPRNSGTIVPNNALGRSSGGRSVDSTVGTYAKSLAKAGRMTEKHAEKLLASADQIRDGIAQRVSSLKQERAGVASGFAGSFGQSVFGSDAMDLQGVLGLAGKQASDSLAVKQAIQALIGKGVSEGALSDLAAGGPGGWEQIKLLAGADKAQLAEFNKLTQIADSNLLAAGNLVGGSLLNDDIQAASRDQRAAERIVKLLENALDKRDKNTTIELHIGPKVIRAALNELARKDR
jgi:hypothetical protein